MGKWEFKEVNDRWNWSRFYSSKYWQPRLHWLSLSLAFNQYRHVPDEIGNLVDLKTLYIRGNQIVRLPSTIGNLINLKTFNCLG